MLMKLKRDQIKEFDIPNGYLAELLDMLEEGLKDVETDLDDEVVYTVINNIIKDKYEINEGYLGLDNEFLLRLVIDTIQGEGDETKIKLWYELTTEFYNNFNGERLYYKRIPSEKNTDDPNQLTHEDILRIEYGVDI